MSDQFLSEIDNCLNHLYEQKCIIAPTDFGMGIIADATNDTMVANMLENGTLFTVFVTEERDIIQYTSEPNLALFDYLETLPNNAIVKYLNPIHISWLLMDAEHFSVPICISRHTFLRHLHKRYKKPLAFAKIISSEKPKLYQANISFEEHIIEVPIFIDFLSNGNWQVR